MAGLARFRPQSLLKLRPQASRNISTSKSNKDTITATKEAVTRSDAKVEKNWVSYGYWDHNKSKDRQAAHLIMFTSVTLCAVGGVFIFYYRPEFTLKDWAQREAFIELRRRERHGLPLINPNIVDPSKFTLPTDEELGDTDIVI